MNHSLSRQACYRAFKMLLLTWCFLIVVSVSFGQITKQKVLLNPQRNATLGSTCSIGQLQLVIRTGDDDLRGGQNNLNVEVHFVDGTMQVFPNVNQGANWANNTTKAVNITLKQLVAPDQIKQFRLIHLAQGGYDASSFTAPAGVATPTNVTISAAKGVLSEDNWNMDQLQAFAHGPHGINVPIASSGMHRFTGSNPSFDINARNDVSCSTANQVKTLYFTFHTGNDDLRGGKDNLNITVHFADGTSQSESNVNHSENWPNGSTRGAEMLLNRPVPVDQIRSVTLETTFTGGSGGDNWNMDSVEIGADDTQHVATSGFHRFSSDWTGPKAKEITIPISK
jgi:hypothetical protein